MSSNNLAPYKKVFCVVLTMFVLAGCQQKKNKREYVRNGRGLRGSTQVNGAASSNLTCGSYKVVGKEWGEVTSIQNDQVFYQSLLKLTAPVLRTLPPEDQLGTVSGQSGQYTGVRFWGNARTTLGSGYGPVDPASAEIRIEIFDDKTCQPKSDGSVRPVIAIHMGAGQPMPQAVDGAINGSMANLTFTDSYGSVILEGSISNNYYSGTMSYTLNEMGNQKIVLGHFAVPYCGFFNCY